MRINEELLEKIRSMEDSYFEMRDAIEAFENENQFLIEDRNTLLTQLQNSLQKINIMKNEIEINNQEIRNFESNFKNSFSKFQNW